MTEPLSTSGSPWSVTSTDEETSDQPAIPASSSRLGTILARVALPLFIFATVLALLLTLSLYLLLPLLTQVQVAGVGRDARSLLSYRAQLAAEVAGLEQERDASVLPFDEPGYEALKALRRPAGGFIAMREEVLRSAQALSPAGDAIRIAALTLEGDTLAVEGDVRNVGTRSITLLSDFTEELKRLPFAASVVPPLYARKDDPGIGMHSPFRILLHIH